MTSIEWTERTWNPVTGCTKVSQGCKNCYAETIANRFWKDRKFTDVRCHPERLTQPLTWRKPSLVFVNSMSDLFHEDVPFEFIHQVFSMMYRCSKHTFQILTKRPERMREFMCDVIVKQEFLNRISLIEQKAVLSNVWLGVSVEDQKMADERIPILLQTPAAIRFVSYEPALGEINILHWLGFQPRMIGGIRYDFKGIDWLIAGGESGPKARPCNIEWIRSAVKQCKDANVPVFVKQLGSWSMQTNTHPTGINGKRLKHSKGGDPSEWPEDLRIREFPEAEN